MIDLMVKDLTKEMTEAKATERNAQEDYEQTMKDSAEKRATDSKSVADKSKAKAELEANTEEKTATEKTHMATLEHIQSLHAECDWLLQYFEVRKEARADEVESLKTAKAVLSGADFSLVQTGVSHRSLRGRA